MASTKCQYSTERQVFFAYFTVCSLNKTNSEPVCLDFASAGRSISVLERQELRGLASGRLDNGFSKEVALHSDNSPNNRGGVQNAYGKDCNVDMRYQC